MTNHIPSKSIFRVIVQGTWNSGKSTFVRTISQEMLNVSDRYEDLNADIASDFGVLSVNYKGLQGEIHLLSNPSSHHFAYMSTFIEAGIACFVIVIDSTLRQAHHNILQQAKQIVSKFADYAPCPYIILANKQDLEDAWDIDALRITLNIPDEIPVVPCIATDKKSVANVLITLCEEILKESEANEEEDAPE